MGLGALTDGLVPTPPMGWNSWNRFGPFVSDQLVRETADALIESGMRDAGYRYVVVDDAWEGSVRSDDGNLEPNLWRFPNMHGLASYLHARELRYGLYTCAGDRTCQGYPGSRSREFVDARRFASWDVDFMKIDWCHSSGLDVVRGDPRDPPADGAVDLRMGPQPAMGMGGQRRAPLADVGRHRRSLGE